MCEYFATLNTISCRPHLAAVLGVHGGVGLPEPRATVRAFGVWLCLLGEGAEPRHGPDSRLDSGRRRRDRGGPGRWWRCTCMQLMCHLSLSSLQLTRTCKLTTTRDATNAVYTNYTVHTVHTAHTVEERSKHHIHWRHRSGRSRMRPGQGGGPRCHWSCNLDRCTCPRARRAR